MEQVLNTIKCRLNEVLADLDHMPTTGNMPRIGIGITTHNRYEIFTKSLQEITRYSPGCKIVVVDDASAKPVSEATYRFNTNVGIAAAKNKCFELLDDCEHIFLFDDDCYPKVAEWWKPYVESPEPHLMYIFKDFSGTQKLNDTTTLYQDGNIRAFSHCRGVMCYFHRSCLEKVGGMDPIFGKWGWEHPDLSNRIFNAGLTTFRFADVPGSEQLLYSADEHQAVATTVKGSERAAQIAKNQSIYDSRKDSCMYVPYRQKENILITTYFTGVPDPQRNSKWQPKPEDLQPLISSLKGQKLVVLHDCLDIPDTVNVKYVRVETSINPYFQRWVSYQAYMKANIQTIDKVFCIDATDIEMLKNPFSQVIDGALYTGDELEVVGCQWLVQHHKHPDLQRFFQEYKDYQLVNAGVMGGDVHTVLAFIKDMVDFYFNAESDAFHLKRVGAGETDMGAFNFIAYTRYHDKLKHGMFVNTEFKANKANNVSWFKHK